MCSCGFRFSEDNRTCISKKFAPILKDKYIQLWFSLKSKDKEHFQSSIIFDEIRMDSKYNGLDYDLKFMLDTLNSDNVTFKLNPNSSFLDGSIVKARMDSLPFVHTSWTYENIFYKRDIKNLYVETNKYCSSIARKIRHTILKKHIGCIKELTRHREKLQDKNICPYAIAYCLWRARTQGFKGYKDVDNWARPPFGRVHFDELGYPVNNSKFYDWIRNLEIDNTVLPSSLPSNLFTYSWFIQHIVGEMALAEFYRCLEYAANWINKKNVKYSVDDVPIFKYMPFILIKNKEGKLSIYKKEKIDKRKLLDTVLCSKKGKKNKIKDYNYVKANLLDNF